MSVCHLLLNKNYHKQIFIYCPHLEQTQTIMSSHCQDQMKKEGGHEANIQQLSSQSSQLEEDQKNQQKVQNRNITLQLYKPTIGVIHAVWLSKNGKIIATNIGSAFSLSNSLIMTCTHNIYSSRINSHANIIQFIPEFSLQKNKRTSQAKIIKVKSLPQTFRNKVLSQVNFEIEPIIEELCLLRLQRTLENAQYHVYPAIGNLQKIDFNKQTDKLAVIGYPSMYFSSRKFRQNQNIKQIEIKGSLVSHEQHRIHYQINTSVGMSGSPIFAMRDNTIIVVGIHTHRGKEKPRFGSKQVDYYNSGLYFNQQILNTIKLYKKQLQIMKQIQDKVQMKKKGTIRFKDKPEKDEEAMKEVEKWKNKEHSKYQQNKQKPPDLLDSEDQYYNKSHLSASFLQEESFQNTSQISKDEYEWIIDLAVMDRILRSISSQQSQQYDKQSMSIQTDSTDTTFLDYH